MTACSDHPPSHPTRQRGYSLVELIWSLGLVTLLVAVGLPPMSQAIQRARAYGVQQQLLGDLRLAQREAVRRGESVTVAARPQTCSPPATQRHNWGCGWLVFLDHNHNGVFDRATDQLIREMADALGLRISSSRERVRFSPLGSTSDVQRFDLGTAPLQVTVSWMRLRT